MGEFIDVTAKDGGRFRAYLALPPAGKGPGLVVGQEIFGVNNTMRRVADGYAEEGYVVLVPDLFWRDMDTDGVCDALDAGAGMACEGFGRGQKAPVAGIGGEAHVAFSASGAATSAGTGKNAPPLHTPRRPGVSGSSSSMSAS